MSLLVEAAVCPADVPQVVRTCCVVTCVSSLVTDQPAGRRARTRRLTERQQRGRLSSVRRACARPDVAAERQVTKFYVWLRNV